MNILEHEENSKLISLVELLKEMSEKHEVPLDRIQTGILGSQLHFWEYEYEKNSFRALEWVTI